MPGTDPTVVAMLGGQALRHPVERLAVCRIGRSEQSAIVLNDPRASREHAMVRRDATGHCYLTDLGSRNGTTLNGRTLTAPARLKHGDVIGIGAQELAFEHPDGDHELEPEAAAATQMFLANSLITVLVIDVRGFTPLSRELGEERISSLMSDIFHHAGELLDRHRSWSQKYIGDAVMGVWVHTGGQVSAAEIAGILDVIAEMRLHFEQLPGRFELPTPIRFGAAINSGQAAIGNMGSATASDFTALGDTVNKTFRLEKATRQVACDLLVGKNVLEVLTPAVNRHDFPPLLPVMIAGFEQPEPAFPFRFDDLPRLATLLAKARRETSSVPGR
jgi:adenylate cyclase